VIGTFTHRMSGHAEQGFTLLELLVALTVSGVVAAMLFSGMRFGTRAWERTRADADSGEEIRVVQDFLRHEIGRAYPLFVATDPANPHVDFTGDATHLAFLAPIPTALDGGGLARLSIAMRSQGGKNSLVLSWQPELAEATGHVSAQSETVLLRRLRNVEFSYFGAKRSGESPNWHSDWTGAVRAPQSIRLAAVFSDPQKYWPPLTITSGISVDVGCTYDPLTKYCRGR
jgi:general secretion pathway protein J